jgi:hypothetical protein
MPLSVDGAVRAAPPQIFVESGRSQSDTIKRYQAPSCQLFVQRTEATQLHVSMLLPRTLQLQLLLVISLRCSGAVLFTAVSVAFSQALAFVEASPVATLPSIKPDKPSSLISPGTISSRNVRPKNRTAVVATQLRFIAIFSRDRIETTVAGFDPALQQR